MYLLIDNYDSFTYNLYQIFAEQGVQLVVKRNDRISIQETASLKPDKIIISPGPKTPDDAGVSNEIIKRFGSGIPILGICLGHQCIAAAFGGRISRVSKIVHGKTSAVYHNGGGIFKDIPSPFPAARYHSLKTVDIPPCLEVTARTGDNIIMGIEHRDLPITGLQFHPESFLTENGRKIIKNFIEL
ncbi:MAG: anthranilate/aminodeoxychorismate synthase component II [Candidatus Makaraimicrobium thalassicum]|nr:MAG: anthranilate/aminodeoxychorismate synthase component II [Candidatus Omnitrophota bacterium]